jgi:translocation and assembly module TamB
MTRPVSILLVLAIAVLCALPFALIHFIAFTPQGLAMIVARVPHRVGPVTLDIGTVSGTIAGGFTLSRFELDHERVHLVAEDIHARLAVAPLLWQKIDVPEVRARNLLIEVRTVPKRPRKGPPKFLPRLLRIETDDARAGLLTLVAPNGTRNEFADIRASGVVRHRSIRVFSAAARFQGMDLTANGTVRAADPMRIDASGRAEWFAPKDTRWIANVTGEGDLDRLPFTGSVEAPFRATVAGAAATLTSGWKITGNAQVSQLDIADFGGGGVLGEIDGRVRIGVTTDGIAADGVLHPAGLEAGNFDVQFNGKYAAKTLAVRHAQFRHQGSGALATVAGLIRIDEAGPSLDLTGQWREFRWPLPAAEPAVHSAQGNYHLAGTMPYAITASGAVTAAGLEPMQVTLEGRLAGDRLDADVLRVGAYEGRGDLRGAVQWQPAEAWQVGGRITGMNTGLLDERLPGRVSFDIDARGEGFSPGGNLDLRLTRLGGQVRGGRASGGGRVIRRGAMLSFHDFDMRLGAAHAQLEGGISPEAYALRFDFDADDLALLDAGATGRLAARGTVSGSRDSPALDATLRGTAIDYAGVQIDGIEGRLRFDGRAGQPLDVDLRARGLTRGARHIDTFAITAQGTTDRHDVQMAVSAAPVVVDARGSGNFQAGTWQLRFQGIDLVNGEEAALRLAAPSLLTLSRDSQRLETTCLRGAIAELCATGNHDPGNWAVTLSAQKLPISTFTVGLTPGVTYEGSVDIEAAAGARGSGPWQGSLRADLLDVQARRRLANNREDVTVIGAGVITGSATADSIVLDARLDAGASGNLTGNALIARSGDEWRDWPLQGELEARTDSLGFIAVLVGTIDRSSGRLATHLQLSGTLGAPRFEGLLTIRDGQFDFYQVNLPLRAVTLDAHFLENTLTLESSATAGDGSLNAGGALTWRKGLPFGKLTMKGENLRIANVPEARVFASPDLVFDVSGRHIDVTGSVLVPNARLDPADITGAVFASADERIVGEPEVDPSKRFTVTTRVNIVLGDRVTIDTFGLSGRLTGALEARTDANDVARGTGELNVAEGRYVAFGRRLDIEHGRLIFNNGPLGDPGIDIRASREFPDVTAGANIRGTLRAPRLTLFSDPQIPQSQILSLLIAGGSLESVQAQEGGRSSNPFAVQGGAILAQQLGEIVGLEDVSLESSLNNETSLVLGRYLTPRLFVSYGISLTEAINTIKMRYTLGDDWTIKLESGAVQSADLEYTIEK